VHILLPPSEAKAAGGRGRSISGRGRAGPLDQARAAVLTALGELLAGDPAVAAGALLLPAGVAADALRVNAAVAHAPTTPALRRYSGVVYDGLGYADLSAAAQRLAGRSVWVFSGLFGVVRGDEPVPAYRVPAKAVLPGIGIAGTFWRPLLEDVLPERFARGLVIDLRSGDYAAMWRPDARTAARTVTVRVLSPTPAGGRAVVSYPSKFAKGRLAAALLGRRSVGDPVRDIEDVAAAWRTIGAGTATITGPRHLEVHTE
jgi:hypothetical protein